MYQPPTQPSRKTEQDDLAEQVKIKTAGLVTVIGNWAGKPNKPADAQENIRNSCAALNKSLQMLFSKRWERSPAIPVWNNFMGTWNNGQGSWTNSHAILVQFNELMKSSE